MKCRPLRNGDQMQCHCGLAWDIGEEKPECPKVCRMCDGTGYFYGDPSLGCCGCEAGKAKLHNPVAFSF